MSKPLITLGSAVVFVLSAVFLYLTIRSHRLDPIRADEDYGTVFIAVIKGFNGPVYYLGSKDGYEYYQIGAFLPKCYKIEEKQGRWPDPFPLLSQPKAEVSFAYPSGGFQRARRT